MLIAMTIPTSSPRSRFTHCVDLLNQYLNYLLPCADLILRLWVANVFFKSGMVKLRSWDSTLSLFAHEYHVPLLNPTFAAYLGTTTELVFPVLLALGLGGRFAALVLFLFNIVAVISYPDLNDVGIEQHQVWGIMLLVVMAHGVGRWSLDYFLHARTGRRDNRHYPQQR